MSLLLTTYLNQTDNHSPENHNSLLQEVRWPCFPGQLHICSYAAQREQSAVLLFQGRKPVWYGLPEWEESEKKYGT